MNATTSTLPDMAGKTDDSPRGTRPAGVPPHDLVDRLGEILDRRPAVGLAVGVVRGGRLELIHGHGVADVGSRSPITQDTVFRIGSITKTVTAIAIMQLWERGLVDLDAPASDYLRAFRLVPASESWRRVTLRHLLTHTAGIPDVRRLSDLLHAGLTPSDGRPPLLNVAFGQPLPSLAEHYRSGLRVVVEPGSAFAYSGPGYATLGQIIEDVTGEPLDRYLRERIFMPLGMTDTDLTRSERLATRLAIGYVLRATGPRAVPDRDWIGVAGGGVYSTPGDMARYVAALLGGGTNEHGRVLQPATLATMFAPQSQPDPRLPGMGLGFFRGEVGGHQTVSHGGILPGFNAELLVAPEDGIGLFGLTNGSSGAFAWLPIELEGLLRQVLGLPANERRPSVPHQPQVWTALCGRYGFPPRIADVRERLSMGGGVEVFVRDGRLMARVLTPIPALYRGLPLEALDESDPYLYRLDLSALGMAPVRAVFASVIDGRATAIHTDLGGMPWSLVRLNDATPWRRLAPALGALALAGVLAALRRRSRRHEEMQP
jgi:CubicO group peptidase (beta-lactamase class C family)